MTMMMMMIRMIARMIAMLMRLKLDTNQLNAIDLRRIIMHSTKSDTPIMTETRKSNHPDSI